jgi:O-antigen/teichoic acid export membrane protein
MSIPVSNAVACCPSCHSGTSFGRDVLKLVSGTALAQMLTILAMPILTRLYAPEPFGTLVLFISVSSIISLVSCMGYELAIMLPKTDEQAANVLGVSLGLVATISAMAVPFVWWSRVPLSQWLAAPRLASYLWCVPPTVFITGTFLALSGWKSRARRFGQLSVARIAQSLATLSTQLGGGCAGIATGGMLIGGHIAGQAAATAVLGGQIWREDRIFIRRSLRLGTMVSAIWRYRRFPLYGSWSALLNSLSWQTPALLLSAFFSPIVAGYYALGFRVLQMPMSLIGSAVAQVFFQRAAKARFQGTVGRLTETIFRRLVLISLFPMLTLAIVGRDLYVVVFGSRWAEAGHYTQILSVWALFWFISSPLQDLTSALEKQRFAAVWNLGLLITRVLSLVVGGLLGNVYLALILFSATGILMYGFLFTVQLGWVGIPWHRTLGMLFSCCLTALPLLCVVAAAKILVSNPWVVLAAAALMFLPYAVQVVRQCVLTEVLA